MNIMTENTLLPEERPPVEYPWIRAWAHVSNWHDADSVAEKMTAKAYEEQAPATALFRFLQDQPWTRLEDIRSLKERLAYMEYADLTGLKIPDRVMRAWLDPDYDPRTAR